MSADSPQNDRTEGDGIPMSLRDESEKKLTPDRMRVKIRELNQIQAILKSQLRQNELERKRLEHGVADAITQQLLPYLADLKQNGEPPREDSLAMIESMLKGVLVVLKPISADNMENLTPQEALIARFVREGKLDRDIAKTLNISRYTVKAHRRTIRRKLGISGKKVDLRALLTGYE